MVEQPERRPNQYAFFYLQGERRIIAAMREENPTKLPTKLASLIIDSPTNNDTWEDHGVKANAGENIYREVVFLVFDEAVRSPDVAQEFIGLLNGHSDEIQERFTKKEPPAPREETPRLSKDVSRSRLPFSNTRYTPIETPPIIEMLANRYTWSPESNPTAKEIVQNWVGERQETYRTQLDEETQAKERKRIQEKADRETIMESPTMGDFFPKFGAWIREYDLDRRDPTYVEIIYHDYRDKQY